MEERVAIIGIFIRAWLRIKQEKETTRRAKLEKEQEQRVNRMNMSFFANISHEFRTPLTMISGPVTQLCESPKIEGENKQLLYIVQRSVGRMLRLVNQLMDFNKLENDTLKLRVKRTDIISQLQRFVDIFRINANEKGIALNTYGLEDTFLMWLDVDKLDKIGAEKVRTLLTDEVGVSAESADEILKFIAITGSNDQVLSALEGYAGRNETFDEGLDQLKTVVKYLSAFGVPEENFAVDLTIARGLDYYTGTVYETALLDHPEIGSVCSGGRYDNLAEYYTDKQLPGVGISIGLTRLFYVLGEQGMLNGDLPTAPADVLILPMTEDLSAAVTLATKLRDAGVRTQLYTEQKKFKAKMNYADKTGVPYVVFLGEDEVKNNVIACKDMTSGEQTTLDFAATLARIRDGLAERNKGKVIVEK